MLKTTNTNTIKMNKLSFGVGNAKLKNDTAILSLPAGHTCKFANLCRSNANQETGKITDGPHTEFRCYAATSEALFKNVRKSRWGNYELLKSAGSVIETAALIERSIPRRDGKTKLVRFHQSGDFFTQNYFDAWLLVAKHNPGLIFYGYTKALPFWIRRLNEIPSNFKIVASRGGTHDNLITMFGLRSVKVVFSDEEANKLNLPIDHDDSHVWKEVGDFAIVIHGTQPKNSEAGKAWYKIAQKGKGGYKSEYFKSYEDKGLTRKVSIDGKHFHVKKKKTELKYMPKWAGNPKLVSA
jgi:hypothetical protein